MRHSGISTKKEQAKQSKHDQAKRKNMVFKTQKSEFVKSLSTVTIVSLERPMVAVIKDIYRLDNKKKNKQKKNSKLTEH